MSRARAVGIVKLVEALVMLADIQAQNARIDHDLIYSQAQGQLL